MTQESSLEAPFVPRCRRSVPHKPAWWGGTTALRNPASTSLQPAALDPAALGACLLEDIKPVAVEQWLRSLTPAPTTKVNLCSLFHLVSQHGRRWELIDGSPIERGAPEQWTSKHTSHAAGWRSYPLTRFEKVKRTQNGHSRFLLCVHPAGAKPVNCTSTQSN